jgi:hypothetical protein
MVQAWGSAGVGGALGGGVEGLMEGDRGLTLFLDFVLGGVGSVAGKGIGRSYYQATSAEIAATAVENMFSVFGWGYVNTLWEHYKEFIR